MYDLQLNWHVTAMVYIILYLRNTKLYQINFFTAQMFRLLGLAFYDYEF